MLARIIEAEKDDLATVHDAPQLFTRTPFHLVCANSTKQATEMLASMLKIEPLGATHRDASGRLPIHVACGNNGQWSDLMVALLLQHHSEQAFARDTTGALPIHFCAKNSGPASGRIAAYLLKACPPCGRMCQIPVTSEILHAASVDMFVERDFEFPFADGRLFQFRDDRWGTPRKQAPSPKQTASAAFSQSNKHRPRLVSEEGRTPGIRSTASSGHAPEASKPLLPHASGVEGKDTVGRTRKLRWSSSDVRDSVGTQGHISAAALRDGHSEIRGVGVAGPAALWEQEIASAQRNASGDYSSFACTGAADARQEHVGAAKLGNIASLEETEEASCTETQHHGETIIGQAQSHGASLHGHVSAASVQSHGHSVSACLPSTTTRPQSHGSGPAALVRRDRAQEHTRSAFTDAEILGVDDGDACPSHNSASSYIQHSQHLRANRPHAEYGTHGNSDGDSDGSERGRPGPVLVPNVDWVCIVVPSGGGVVQLPSAEAGCTIRLYSRAVEGDSCMDRELIVLPPSFGRILDVDGVLRWQAVRGREGREGREGQYACDISVVSCSVTRTHSFNFECRYDYCFDSQ